MKIRTVGAELFHSNAQTPMTKYLKIFILFFFFTKKKYILCLHIPVPFMSKSNPNVTKREMCWFNTDLFSDKILSMSNFHSLGLKRMQELLGSLLYPARSRWGNVSWMLFQEGRSSNFGQDGELGRTHTLAINPTSSVLEFIVHKQ